MSERSVFKVGRLVLFYEYDVPYHSVFLFDRQDVRVEGHFCGYATTAGNAMGRLQAAGFTADFFADVLAPHLEGFEEHYLESLYDCAPGGMTWDEFQQRGVALSGLDLSPFIRKEASDLDQYRDLLSALIDQRRRNALRCRLKTLGLDDDVLDWHLLVPLRHAVKRLRNPILVDVDGLSYIPLRLGFYVPKGVLRTAHILQSIRYYAGFFELFVAWLLISIVPPTANVSLDLSDFIGEGEDPLGQLQSTLEALREEAVLKLDAYNRAFSLLAQRDPALADTAKKDRITRSLREAAEETDRFRKGRLLEKALTELFEPDDSFRARTGVGPSARPRYVILRASFATIQTCVDWVCLFR